jgi:hypothetical protein
MKSSHKLFHHPRAREIPYSILGHAYLNVGKTVVANIRYKKRRKQNKRNLEIVKMEEGRWRELKSGKLLAGFALKVP